VIRDELDQAHAAAIRRHWRDMTDTGGQPNAALLDELAAVAYHHAADVTEAAKAEAAAAGDCQPEHAKPAARTPRRRAPKA
jgi:hypothetical protein